MRPSTVQLQKKIPSSLAVFSNSFLSVLLLSTLAWPLAANAQKSSSLEERFKLVLPTQTEQEWKAVGWLTNLMKARENAQELKRPIFLWIMVGNPHGCT
jgi:hypothetical protein|tara:strand:- start:718 stop:1014 length:297 start_codon:yes stop_codon:yes gene_type:complete